jgi:hypothetical protein
MLLGISYFSVFVALRFRVMSRRKNTGYSIQRCANRPFRYGDVPGCLSPGCLRGMPPQTLPFAHFA